MMKDYKINKVAVLGSGIMGSRIAAQLANVGLNVILIDSMLIEIINNKIEFYTNFYSILLKSKFYNPKGEHYGIS